MSVTNHVFIENFDSKNSEFSDKLYLLKKIKFLIQKFTVIFLIPQNFRIKTQKISIDFSKTTF